MKKLRFFLRLMSVKEIDIWVKEIDTEIHRLEKSSVTILSCMDKLCHFMSGTTSLLTGARSWSRKLQLPPANGFLQTPDTILQTAKAAWWFFILICWHANLFRFHINLPEIALLADLQNTLFDQLKHSQETDDDVYFFASMFSRELAEAHAQFAGNTFGQVADHFFQAHDFLDGDLRQFFLLGQTIDQIFQSGESAFQSEGRVWREDRFDKTTLTLRKNHFLAKECLDAMTSFFDLLIYLQTGLQVVNVTLFFDRQVQTR